MKMCCCNAVGGTKWTFVNRFSRPWQETSFVIVGVGVSRALSGGAPTCTWSGLIPDVVERVNSTDPNDGALLAMRVESVTEADDLVSLAEDLKRRRGDDFGRWMDLSSGKDAIQLANGGAYRSRSARIP